MDCGTSSFSATFGFGGHAFLVHEAAHLFDEGVPDLGVEGHGLLPFQFILTFSPRNLFPNGTLVEG
jgi:hypothetical protein